MNKPPILVLRPEPGASATAKWLRDMGLEPVMLPLFEIAPLDWDAPDAARFDALALSSANALRHGGSGLASLTDLPVYAVGEATATAARAAGFAVAGVGTGGIAGLEPLLRSDGRSRILRLTGRDFIDFAPHDMQVETIPVYAARETPVDAERLRVLSSGGIALLYSVRAAERFDALLIEAGRARSDFRIVAISPAVADAAGAGWMAVAAASESHEASLLSALQNMLEADASTGRQGSL